MVFTYEAFRKGGEKVFGTIESGTKDMAARALYQQDMVVISLKPMKRDNRLRVKEEELIFFTRLLATAVNASIPLTRALEITSSELTEKSGLRFVISSLLHDLKIGKSLSDALQVYQNIFSELYVNMVRSGEKSGKLGGALLDVLKYLQKRYEMKKKIGSAMLYPGMIMGFAGVILVFFTIFLIPRFKESYANFGSDLPALTNYLINITEFIKSNIFTIIGAGAVLVYLIYRYIRTEKGRLVYEKLLFMIPIIGELYKKDVISRLSRTLFVLLSNGITLIEALELCRGIVNSKTFNLIIVDGIKELTQGGKLSNAFKGSKYIPSIFIQMTAMGEESGKVAELMESLSDFYEKEVDTSIDQITSVITPVMVVFIGLVIGVIVIALFLPIFNLSNVIK